MDDEAIIGLFWERSETAITAASEAYGPYCRTIAQNILADPRDAEECVNDTWLRAWNAMPPQRPSRLRLFLGKITRNLALTRYRRFHAEKRGGGQTALALEELGDCVSGGNPVEAEEDRRAIAEAINRFLGSLPELQRNVFLRRYWHMASVADIAKAYGMSQSQTASMLHRCRKKLRAALEKEGIGL